MPFMNNPAMYGTRGMLGKTLVYKDWYGRTLVTNKPKKRKSISEKQVTTIDNFKNATRFAKALMKKPEKKALYIYNQAIIQIKSIMSFNIYLLGNAGFEPLNGGCFGANY